MGNRGTNLNEISAKQERQNEINDKIPTLRVWRETQATKIVNGFRVHPLRVSRHSPFE